MSPATIETNKSCKQEDGKVSFPLDRATPIPGARQPAIDTAASVVEVIRSRAVKSMPEEVREDLFDEPIDGTELLFDKSVDGWTAFEGGDLSESGGDRKEDAVDLGIFVDEHQGIRNVVVTHMNDRGADPCADALLSSVEDDMHYPRRLGSHLYTVQALTGVTQPVCRILRQEVLFGQRPQVKHIM